jgi:two-component system, NtrC family, response regulator GlrR
MGGEHGSDPPCRRDASRGNGTPLAVPTASACLEAGTRAASVEVERFRLVTVAGQKTGRTIVSGGERTVVGTDPSAHVVLADPVASGFHCEIALKDGRALVRDLGSEAGTWVDGVEVREAFLADGAILTVGGTRLRCDLNHGHIRVPVSERARFGNLVGQSRPMRAAFSLLERAAECDATVLITGETGTGKGAAAEAIHLESRRAAGPFVVVDCSALPPPLLESELFGHERGAFTGAVTAREGAFQAASGGTLFLDELGELPMDLQPKLLSALERREVKPVGRDEHVPVDVRLVAASNRDLRGEVNARRFRTDLFYRLAVVEVGLPPLREHPEDIPLLVEDLLARLEDTDHAWFAYGRTPEFFAALARHTWPGNVRELRNYIERCVALKQRVPIVPLPGGASEPVIDVTVPLKSARDAWLVAFERTYLTSMLAEHDGNVSAAARAAGVDRVHFYRLLWRHGLR